MRRLILEIGLGLLLLISLVILLYQVNSSKDYKATINQLEKSNSDLQNERDALRCEILSLEDSIVRYSKLIEVTNNKIDSLRQQRYEKVNVIVNLPLDESVEFLSNYLSKDSGL